MSRATAIQLLACGMCLIVVSSTPGRALASPKGDTRSNDLAESLEVAFPPMRRTGAGVISGRVLENGAPCPGVEIVLQPALPPRKHRDADLWARLKQIILRHREREACSRKTATAADGSYRFDDLPEDVRYDLRSGSTAYNLMTGFDTPRGLEVGNVVDLDVHSQKPVMTHPVKVNVFHDGQLVPTARVNFERQSLSTRNRSSSRWSAIDPQIEVREGNLSVGAERRDLASEPQTLTIVPDALPGTVDLHLTPRTWLVGWVRNEGEERVDLFRSQGARPAPGDPTPENSERLSHRPLGGSFTDRTVEPGQHTIVAVRRDKVVQAWPITIETGYNFVKLDLDPLGAESILEVSVQGPGDADVEEIAFQTLFVEERATGPYRVGGLVTVTRQSGNRFWLEVDERTEPVLRGKLPHALYLRADSKEWGRAHVELRPGTHRVTVRFDNPAICEVEVEPYLGSGLEGRLSVSLIRSTPYSAGDGFGQSSADWLGEFPTMIVQPGTYRADLHLAQGPFGGQLLSSFSVTLRPGRDTLRFRVPELHDVEITFDPEHHGSKVRLSERAFGGGPSKLVRPQVEFQGLKAGVRWVQVGTNLMKIRLPETQAIHFEPQPYDALLVTAALEDHPLVAAGIRVGDRCVGLDGERFQNLTEAANCFRSILRSGKGVLQIARGDEILEISLTQEQAREGVDFEPCIHD